MKKETLNKEETQAVKELIEKIPDEALEKAVGGLRPRTKQILKGIGATALTAAIIWLVTDKLKNDIKSSDNDNTKLDNVPSAGSRFNWEWYNNDNEKFDDPNFGEPSAPPY